jgi:hypothetical protein
MSRRCSLQQFPSVLLARFWTCRPNTISSGIAPTTTILGPGPGCGAGQVKSKSALLQRASNFKARPDAL